MKKFHVTGYPDGLTAGPALVLVAQSDGDARAKAVEVLRGRGCDVAADVLSVSEDKPRLLERYP